MSTKEDQPLLLAKIRALSERIADYRRRFSLPKGHKDRYETHGAASALQKLKRERQSLQGQLDAPRLVASGISCRDCLHFRDYPHLPDNPYCGKFEGDEIVGLVGTKWARMEHLCGSEAKGFQPVAAHA